MKRATIFFIALIIGLLIGGFSVKWYGKSHTAQSVATTYDTIPVPHYYPVPKDSVVLRYEVVKLPKVEVPTIPADSVIETVLPAVKSDEPGDSVAVVIPIEQKVYSDSDYTAYVSGFRVSLDSIFVNRIVERTTIRAPTQPRFSVGLQAGYGYTPKGFQPYLGIGVSINLWSR